MAKTACRPEPTIFKSLAPQRQNCPGCGLRMWLDYTNYRTVVTLDGCMRLALDIRRCHHRECAAYLRPYRPESEGRFALPKHEFGLDVITLIGTLRYGEHRSVPEIHATLLRRDVGVSQRTVTNLLDRYDELLAVALSDDRRLKKLLAEQGRVILAIDGLQPDVGHEVLWVLRDCISGEVLLAKSLPSARPPAGPGRVAGRGQGAPGRDRGRRRRGGLRRPAVHPQGGRQGAARGGASVVPLPLPARGGPADP